MAATLNPADANSWWDFVTKFDATYTTFYDNYNALMALGPYIQTKHPELLSQYMDMLQKGSENANQLEGLKATRDYVYSWLQWLASGASDVSSFLYSSAQTAYDYAKQALGLNDTGLGVIPVAIAAISAAAAIAALVVIAKWITDAYVFAQRLNALQDAESKGMTPQAAAAFVDQTLGPATSPGLFGIPWTLLIWGAVAIFVGPPIIRALTDGRR